jgi:hypothetical protein
MSPSGYTGEENTMKSKAHLVIPEEILAEVDRIAGKRRRSLFIAEATREKLERERFLKVLEETKGAWTDKNHPDLKTDMDVEQYVRGKRQSYRSRIKRIINE